MRSVRLEILLFERPPYHLQVFLIETAVLSTSFCVQIATPCYLERAYAIRVYANLGSAIALAAQHVFAFKNKISGHDWHLLEHRTQPPDNPLFLGG